MALIEQMVEERHEQNRERSAEIVQSIETLRLTFEAEMRQQRQQFESLYRLLLQRGQN